MKDRIGSALRKEPNMQRVSFLEQVEQPRINSDRLVELYVAMGEAGARRTMTDAIEAIAARVTDLFSALHKGRFDLVAALSLEVCEIARPVGLTSCAFVAEDLNMCAQTGDQAASAAVLNRLARLGAASARQSWSIRDFST